ncbi:MAG: aminoacyl-tRNA hydrolase [bacterium]|nr:aminoacyl-tRNA hydrolase [bacterium]
METVRLVIGLGNPGERYRDTRHNVGFRVLDRLARRADVRFRADRILRSQAWIAKMRGPSGRVVLAKPRTYMNRSGRAVATLCRRFAVPTEQVLTVYDDIDLQLGRMRIRPSGSSGGHNGIRSLMTELGSGEFLRVRIGIRGDRPEGQELADYVLGRFTADEESLVEPLTDLAADAVGCVLAEGVVAAMNLFNARRIEE